MSKIDRNVNQIGKLIRLYAKNIGKEEEYLEAKIKNHWAEIVGENIAQQTSTISLSNHKIYIKISSPIVKNQLFAVRENLKNYLIKFIDYQIDSIAIF